MSVITTLNLDSAASWTFNTANIEVTGGFGRQIDQASSTSVMCWATYTTGVDLNYGGGNLSGTVVGTATVSGGELDLNSDVLGYVSYDADGNADSQQQGCVRLLFRPNYNTKPPSDSSYFIHIAKESGALANGIVAYHSVGDQKLYWWINNSASANIGGINSFLWTAVLGTQYEFELNWDIDAGQSRFFIDGVQQGSTHTGTGVRGSDIGLFRVGTNPTGVNKSSFKLDDLIVFDSVQHTANYTPGYTLAENRYLSGTLESTIGIKTDSYLGFSQAVVASGTASMRWMLKNNAGSYLYWTGAAWSTSDETFTQANCATIVNANIGDFPITATTEKIYPVGVFQNDNYNSIELSAVGIQHLFYEDQTDVSQNCVINFYVHDFLGSAVTNAVLTMKPRSAFYHTDNLIVPNQVSTSANAEGYIKMEIIETETVSQTVDFSLTYTDTNGISKKISFNGATIPNQDSVDGIDLLTIT